jgi:error-prone DNA polymerase
MTVYAELAAASNFSFLRGASHPQDMVLAALLLGQSGIGIADRNTVAGVVRAWSVLRELREDGWSTPQKVRQGGSPGEIGYVASDIEVMLDPEAVKAQAEAFKLMVGARLAFEDGSPEIIAYPETRTGWGQLCRLLTLGNLRGKKGECRLTLPDLIGHCEDLLLIVMPSDRLADLKPVLTRLDKARPGAVWLGAPMQYRGDDQRRVLRMDALARSAGVPLLAVNDALYHTADQRDLQDVMTCIREKTTIHQAGRRLQANAERHLKTPEEMARLFRSAPHALAEIPCVMNRVRFDLEQLRYDYPEEPVPPGETPQGWLEKQTWLYAEMRYYETGIPEKVVGLLNKELAFIAKQKLAPYFLTIHEIVRRSNDVGILCQGRGSAANSAVCYVLGITSVDPNEHDLLFERFLSTAVGEPPDIDVDFEHERREDIMQWIYRRYGRDRAGIAATVIRYRPRSAMREVGKVMGLSEDVTARLAGTQWGHWGSDIPDEHVEQAGLEADNPTVRQAIKLAKRLLGFPRHLSQHVGGFILTQGRLDELVPIGNAAMADRTFIEWDRDDIDALKLMKVDVLALGMLTCIKKAFDMIRDHGGPTYDLASVPLDLDAVYDMLRDGDSLGVFQVESRAQMNMLPRLRPREFYDLVIQVAIVRPGPIQGDMVHPYLRRRNGEETVVYPSPSPDKGEPDELHQILKRTNGVPLFQEQAMKIAMVAAEFSDVETRKLRKAMGTFRGDGKLHLYEEIFVGRMIARGYEADFAQRCYDQIKGFGSYGFPESHAASFAKLVYISSYIKWLYPAVFATALLNSQPMGFYAPAQIIRDAQQHGAQALPIDVNHSVWDNVLEGSGSLTFRLGFRQIDGFRGDWANLLEAGRDRPYRSIEALMRRGRLPVGALRKLADADALRSIGLDRREALWAVRRLPNDAPLTLFQAADARELGEEADAALPVMPLGEHVAADYQMTRLSLKAHPMSIIRPVFEAEGVLTCAQAVDLPKDTRVRVAGVVLVRQRPGNGKAIFVTIEDETGVANIVMWADQFDRFRREVMSARLMEIEGVIERSKEDVVHVMTRRVFDRSSELGRLSEDHETKVQLSGADEFAYGPKGSARHPRDVRILPGSRDFH